MKIVVADDEPLARALLRSLLEEMPGLEVVAEAADGVEATELAQKLSPDLVFLDIDMPGGNGIHAAVEITRHASEVIFVTAHEEHAIDAFEVGAIDYILKPLRRPRLARAMERARRRHEARQVPTDTRAAAPDERSCEEDAAFWIAGHGRIVRVAVADIVRVEAAADHVYFHTAERAYLYRITMGELEKRLRGSGLMRVHRSAFVRPDRVTGMRRHGKVLELTLDDGTEVSVGPRYREATLARLQRVPARRSREAR